MVQSCDGEKYSTYILELIRNNGITNLDEGTSADVKLNEEVPFIF